MNGYDVPQVEQRITRARRTRITLLLFSLALLIGFLIGFNVITAQQVADKAADKVIETAVAAIAVAFVGGRL